MESDNEKSSRRMYLIISGTLILLIVLWIPFSIGRVLFGVAPWGPKIGGKLPDGTFVYFQARPGGFETDDRLTVIAPNMTQKHYWVDRVHGGFEHVVLKVNDTGNQVWVESDGKVGASIDLTTSDFRAESDSQHAWAIYGTGTTLDSGDTSTIISLLRPW